MLTLNRSFNKEFISGSLTQNRLLQAVCYVGISSTNMLFPALS